MNSFRICLFACLCLSGLLSFNDAEGQSCNCSACTGGLTTFISSDNGSIELAKNKWIADASFELMDISFSGIKTYNEETAKSNGILENVFVSTAGLSYGLSDHISVSVHLPYLAIQSAYRNERTSAFGDGNILGTYSFSLNKSKTLLSGVSAGLKLPTGQETEINDFALGLSSGSVDPMAGAWISYSNKKLSAIGSVNYKYSTTGFNRTRHGNTFVHDVSLRYLLIENNGMKDTILSSAKAFALQVEAGVRGEKLTAQSQYGEQLPNSGNYILYAHGGLRTQINKHVSIPISVSIPVFETITGFQNVPRLRFNLSIQYLF